LCPKEIGLDRPGELAQGQEEVLAGEGRVPAGWGGHAPALAPSGTASAPPAGRRPLTRGEPHVTISTARNAERG